ncbi:hypothetical protein LMG31506_06402 [Cupriavidus yeoncheonensis]|uniref:Uncharacterized protein n=1 Tax=Cupriavidus yeoncheonensis TaxID=1462994 RepID=A0A916J1G6_9BURK|nr:hypothetical protein [Cupriavidus yeoncheonensis]CAG2158511.1 hypothetical protein LMG31506_06402 [Cupriavidus yeoncheonensis]
MSAVLAYLLVAFCSMSAAAFFAYGADTFMIAIVAAHLGMFHGML